MSTVTFDALRKLATMREFLSAFEAGTSVRLDVIPNHQKLPPAPVGCKYLRVPVFVGGEHVATLHSELLAVAAVCDRRAEQLHELETHGGGHRPPLQISEEQFRGLETLVTIFARQLSAFANRHLTASHAEEPPQIRIAKEYIQEHACNSITIDKITQHVHMSADHLRRIFGRATGVTLTECIQRVRIVKAKELLADHSRRVIDVAFACGFQSVPHFNRVFKSCTGKTPKAFRASLGAGQ